MAFVRRSYEGIVDLKEWVKQYVTDTLNTALATKANKSHTHTTADITNLSTNKVPDYTRFFDISINETYTATEDGFVMLLLGTSNNGSVFLNITQSDKTSSTQVQIGYDYLYKYNYGNDFCSASLYPIRKGDKWSISKSGNNTWRILRFYYAR